MDTAGKVGKIKVCCRIRPLETRATTADDVDVLRSLSDSSGRNGARRSTPIAIQNGHQVHVQLEPAHIAHTDDAATRLGEDASLNSVAARRSFGSARGNRRRDRWEFSFDDVLADGCRQHEVYTTCAKDIVDTVPLGLNGTIIAYGCTGAGKSYTMMGERYGTEQQRGICARALQDVFRNAHRRNKKHIATAIQMSFVEIYNEQLFDLLQPPTSPVHRRFTVHGKDESATARKRMSSSSPVTYSAPASATAQILESRGDSRSQGSGRPRVHARPARTVSAPLPLQQQRADQYASELSIYERPDGSTHVKGLSILPVTTESEALSIVRVGQANRETAAHQLNHASSSREGNDECPGIEEDEDEHRKQRAGATTSKLNLVDLAGSERAAAAAAAGEGGGADAAMVARGGATVLHREGRFINKSLTFLEQVTIALADKSRQHVPFRQSKLTHFLKDSLGGNCRTLMIACIWPRPDLLSQTLRTLKFASRMRCIKNSPVINEEHISTEDEVFSLRRQVRQLKAELALKSGTGPYTTADVGCMSSEQSRYTLEGDRHFVMARQNTRRYASSFVGEVLNCTGSKCTRDGEETAKRFEGGETQRQEHVIEPGDDAINRADHLLGASFHGGSTLTTANATATATPAVSVSNRFRRESGEQTDSIVVSSAAQEEAKVICNGHDDRYSCEEGEGRSIPQLFQNGGLSDDVASDGNNNNNSDTSRTKGRYERHSAFSSSRSSCQSVFVPPASTTEPLDGIVDYTSSLVPAVARAHDPRLNIGQHMRAPVTSTVDEASGVAMTTSAVSSDCIEFKGHGNRIEKERRMTRDSKALGAQQIKREAYQEHHELTPRSAPDPSSLRAGVIVDDKPRPLERQEKLHERRHQEKRGEHRKCRRRPLIPGDSNNIADPAGRRKKVVGKSERGDNISHRQSSAASETCIITPAFQHSSRTGTADSDERRRGDDRRAMTEGDPGGAFARFKRGDGRDIHGTFQEAKAAVKQGRSLVNHIAGLVNNAKGRIDGAQVQVEELRQGDTRRHEKGEDFTTPDRSPSDMAATPGVTEQDAIASLSAGPETSGALRRKGVIDTAVMSGGGIAAEGSMGDEKGEQRLLAVTQLKERKREYRGLFKRLITAKGELRKLHRRKEKALAMLATEFERRHRHKEGTERQQPR